MLEHLAGGRGIMQSSPFPFRQPGPPFEPGHTDPVSQPARSYSDGEWLGRLYERLLANRVILAHGRLDDLAVTALAAQLLTLDAESVEPIHLHLQVSDAQPQAAVTLIDVLDQMIAPVCATVLGELGGAALGVLAAVPLRRAAPHATFRLVEPGGGLLQPGMSVSASGLSAEADRRTALLNVIYGRIAARAGKTLEVVRDDAQRKRYLTAVEAVEYGLVDEIAVPPPSALM